MSSEHLSMWITMTTMIPTKSTRSSSKLIPNAGASEIFCASDEDLCEAIQEVMANKIRERIHVWIMDLERKIQTKYTIVRLLSKKKKHCLVDTLCVSDKAIDDS